MRFLDIIAPEPSVSGGTSFDLVPAIILGTIIIVAAVAVIMIVNKKKEK